MPMGMTIPRFAILVRWLSYRRRFPVVYLTFKAMRRPRLVNKQLGVFAFFVYVRDDLKSRDIYKVYIGCMRMRD